MIKSMTGFGRYETVTDEYRIAVEIKSVNHRYCDLNIKLPKKFNEIENTLRMMMKEIAERGKVDVYVSYEDYAGKGTHVHYHPQIAKEYVKVAAQVAEEFELHNSCLRKDSLDLQMSLAWKKRAMIWSRYFQ